MSAIRQGLRSGEDGSPSVGGGDRNDGVNLVGHRDQGESVGLAFFLYDVLKPFSRVTGRRGDPGFARAFGRGAIPCGTLAAR